MGLSKENSSVEVRTSDESLKPSGKSVRAGVFVLCMALTAVLAATLYWQTQSSQEEIGENYLMMAEAVQQTVYQGGSSVVDNLVIVPVRALDIATESTAQNLAWELHSLFESATNVSLIGRESSGLLESFPTNPQLLRRLMNAAYMLRSTLEQDGDTFILNLELIDTQQGAAVWQQRYSGLESSLLTDCADVVRELQLVLGYSLQTQALTSDALSAQQKVKFQLAGRDVRTGGLEELRRAISSLQELKRAAPGYMPARYLQWRAVDEYTMATNDDLGFNRVELLDEMLNIDAGHRGARRAYAMRLWFERSYVSSWRAFDELMREDPDDLETAVLFVDFLLTTGYVSEALSLARRNLHLDPINVGSHIKVANAARISGDNEVLAQHAALLKQIGGHSYKMFDAVLAFRQDKLDESADLYEAFTIEVGGDPTWIRPFLSQVREDRDAALEVLDNASPEAKSFEVLFMNIYAMYGFYEQALEVMQFGLSEDWRMPNEIWSPEFAGVRALAGFTEGIRSTGLAELWRHRGEPDHCRFDQDGQVGCS